MGILDWLRWSGPTGWRPYKVQPFDNIRLKDGSIPKLADVVMCRRVADGIWEYRWPTEKEAAEDFADRQW
jgi:hypothetical protein